MTWVSAKTKTRSKKSSSGATRFSLSSIAQQLKQVAGGSHPEAARLGDRVGVIDAGRVVQEGTPTELAAAPRSAFVATD